jgi:hypothetical protein
MSELQAKLKAIRGMGRRMPQSVQKMRAELLAIQLRDGAPKDRLGYQMAVMSGRPLPVRKAIEDHSPAFWATLQAARAQMGGE